MALIVGALVVTGCGSSSAMPSPTPTPSATALVAVGTPSPTSSSPPQLSPTPSVVPVRVAGSSMSLGPGDNGKALLMHPGETLVVDFAGRETAAPFSAWSLVQSSDQQVLHGTTTSGKDSSVHGTFVAGAVGSAQLTATNDPHCQPVACMVPSMLWSVLVTVVSGS